MSEQSEMLEKKFLEGFEEMIPDTRTRKILLNAIDVFAKKGWREQRSVI